MQVFFGLEVGGAHHIGGSAIPGVTGQIIPPAGLYPGILWPRQIHTPSGHNIGLPWYNLAWAFFNPIVAMYNPGLE